MTGDRVPSGRKLCGHSAGAIPDRRPLAPNQTGICHFDGGCCVGPDLLPVNPRTPLWSCCLVIADAFESVPPTGSLDCIPPGDLTAAPSPTIMVSLGPVWLPANPGVPGLELPPVPARSAGWPRIHGELLKLGITVSQATVSRYMPMAHGDRRSQRWGTFVRNHAAAIVRSRSFEGHSWADDLRLQLLPWAHAFKRQAAEVFFTAVLAGPPCSTAWHLVDSRLLAAARLRVRFAAGAALTVSSTALACRCTPPARKVGLLVTDRIRGPPHRAHTERPYQTPINELAWRSVCPACVRLGTAAGDGGIQQFTAIRSP
jgi:hypothetical protein